MGVSIVRIAAVKPDQSLSIFFIFLRLGLTSFGGPVAHLAFFRETFVRRRQWLSESAYTDLVALCQFLPGPASSQVGLALGWMRGGYAGALAAWLGFTLPSAMMLIVLASSMQRLSSLVSAGVVHGLKVATVAVVAQAVWGMAKTLCADVPRVLIMLIAAVVAFSLPLPGVQIGILLLAGAAGWCGLRLPDSLSIRVALPYMSRRTGLFWLAAFTILLTGLPVLAKASGVHGLEVFNAFYRAGALVFGGGHVFLPLLQAAVVPAGWVDRETFLAGYGVTQAMPGPLFTFSAFLGASLHGTPGGWVGGMVCLIAAFLPGALLLFGALPFWTQLSHSLRARAALDGVNAAVVGLLLAAFISPVIISAIHHLQDVLLAGAALLALLHWRSPPWLVVLVCGGMGVMLPPV
ncbi:chromate efflux transporter [Burkholderiaceae bacterium DAT-1]|nr:chromate efflux transporter [Burkholderiaceae bacterium DAT-1]